MPLYSKRFEGQERLRHYRAAAGTAAALTRMAPGYTAMNPLMDPNAQFRQSQALGADTALAQGLSMQRRGLELEAQRTGASVAESGARTEAIRGAEGRAGTTFDATKPFIGPSAEADLAIKRGQLGAIHAQNIFEYGGLFDPRGGLGTGATGGVDMLAGATPTGTGGVPPAEQPRRGITGGLPIEQRPYAEQLRAKYMGAFTPTEETAPARGLVLNGERPTTPVRAGAKQQELEAGLAQSEARVGQIGAATELAYAQTEATRQKAAQEQAIFENLRENNFISPADAAKNIKHIVGKQGEIIRTEPGKKPEVVLPAPPKPEGMTDAQWAKAQNDRLTQIAVLRNELMGDAQKGTTTATQVWTVGGKTIHKGKPVKYSELTVREQMQVAAELVDQETQAANPSRGLNLGSQVQGMSDEELMRIAAGEGI